MKVDTKNDNELIAEFMGNSPLWGYPDWNNLMPVIEKIRSIESYDGGDKFGTIVIMEGQLTKIKSGAYWSDGKTYDPKIYYDRSAWHSDPLQSVYTAVVDYIKWYKERTNG